MEVNSNLCDQLVNADTQSDDHEPPRDDSGIGKLKILEVFSQIGDEGISQRDEFVISSDCQNEMTADSQTGTMENTNECNHNLPNTTSETGHINSITSAVNTLECITLIGNTSESVNDPANEVNTVISNSGLESVFEQEKVEQNLESVHGKLKIDNESNDTRNQVVRVREQNSEPFTESIGQFTDYETNSVSEMDNSKPKTVEVQEMTESVAVCQKNNELGTPESEAVEITNQEKRDTENISELTTKPTNTDIGIEPNSGFEKECNLKLDNLNEQVVVSFFDADSNIKLHAAVTKTDDEKSSIGNENSVKGYKVNNVKETAVNKSDSSIEEEKLKVVSKKDCEFINLQRVPDENEGTFLLHKIYSSKTVHSSRRKRYNRKRRKLLQRNCKKFISKYKISPKVNIQLIEYFKHRPFPNKSQLQNFSSSLNVPAENVIQWFSTRRRIRGIWYGSNYIKKEKSQKCKAIFTKSPARFIANLSKIKRQKLIRFYNDNKSAKSEDITKISHKLGLTFQIVNKWICQMRMYDGITSATSLSWSSKAKENAELPSKLNVTGLCGIPLTGRKKLKQYFRERKFPSSPEVAILSENLKLTTGQVETWFRKERNLAGLLSEGYNTPDENDESSTQIGTRNSNNVQNIKVKQEVMATESDTLEHAGKSKESPLEGMVPPFIKQENTSITKSTVSIKREHNNDVQSSIPVKKGKIADEYESVRLPFPVGPVYKHDLLESDNKKGRKKLTADNKRELHKIFKRNPHPDRQTVRKIASQINGDAKSIGSWFAATRSWESQKKNKKAANSEVYQIKSRKSNETKNKKVKKVKKELDEEKCFGENVCKHTGQEKTKHLKGNDSTVDLTIKPGALTDSDKALLLTYYEKYRDSSIKEIRALAKSIGMRTQSVAMWFFHHKNQLAAHSNKFFGGQQQECKLQSNVSGYSPVQPSNHPSASDFPPFVSSVKSEPQGVITIVPLDDEPEEKQNSKKHKSLSVQTLALLQEAFEKNMYPEIDEVAHLSACTNLKINQITNWFAHARRIKEVQADPWIMFFMKAHPTEVGYTRMVSICQRSVDCVKKMHKKYREIMDKVLSVLDDAYNLQLAMESPHNKHYILLQLIQLFQSNQIPLSNQMAHVAKRIYWTRDAVYRWFVETRKSVHKQCLSMLGGTIYHLVASCNDESPESLPGGKKEPQSVKQFINGIVDQSIAIVNPSINSGSFGQNLNDQSNSVLHVQSVIVNEDEGSVSSFISPVNLGTSSVDSSTESVMSDNLLAQNHYSLNFDQRENDPSVFPMEVSSYSQLSQNNKSVNVSNHLQKLQLQTNPTPGFDNNNRQFENNNNTEVSAKSQLCVKKLQPDSGSLAFFMSCNPNEEDRKNVAHMYGISVEDASKAWIRFRKNVSKMLCRNGYVETLGKRSWIGDDTRKDLVTMFKENQMPNESLVNDYCNAFHLSSSKINMWYLIARNQLFQDALAIDGTSITDLIKKYHSMDDEILIQKANTGIQQLDSPYLVTENRNNKLAASETKSVKNFEQFNIGLGHNNIGNVSQVSVGEQVISIEPMAQTAQDQFNSRSSDQNSFLNSVLNSSQSASQQPNKVQVINQNVLFKSNETNTQERTENLGLTDHQSKKLQDMFDTNANPSMAEILIMSKLLDVPLMKIVQWYEEKRIKAGIQADLDNSATKAAKNLPIIGQPPVVPNVPILIANPNAQQQVVAGQNLGNVTQMITPRSDGNLQLSNVYMGNQTSSANFVCQTSGNNIPLLQNVAFLGQTPMVTGPMEQANLQQNRSLLLNNLGQRIATSDGQPFQMQPNIMLNINNSEAGRQFPLLQNFVSNNAQTGQQTLQMPQYLTSLNNTQAQPQQLLFSNTRMGQNILFPHFLTNMSSESTSTQNAAAITLETQNADTMTGKTQNAATITGETESSVPQPENVELVQTCSAMLETSKDASSGCLKPVPDKSKNKANARGKPAGRKKGKRRKSSSAKPDSTSTVADNSPDTSLNNLQPVESSNFPVPTNIVKNISVQKAAQSDQRENVFHVLSDSEDRYSPPDCLGAYVGMGYGQKKGFKPATPQLPDSTVDSGSLTVSHDETTKDMVEIIDSSDDECIMLD